MCCCFFSFCSPESSTPSPFSLQPMPSLMPSSSLQPPPLLVPSASLQSLTSPPSCSPSTPLSEVEPPSSLQPRPSLTQWSSLQSPPLPSALLQPPPWMMPPSSPMQPYSESPPSYSLSAPFSAVEKNEEGNSMSCKRKERIVWTEELHQKFVWAVEQLGGPHKSVPKRILEIMNNSELNPSHISSHLQKYRKCLEAIKGALKTDLEKIRSPYVVHEQYPVMNDINMYMMPSEMNYSDAALEQRAKCHQLHHPNPYMESNMLMPSPFSQQPSSSLQPLPSLMPWSSLHSPPLLQPPPLLVPSASLSLPPSYFLSSSPLSTVEESDMLTPSPFSPQPSSSPQPPPSLMQWSSMHSPPLLQPPPLLVPSTSLPSPPSYSLSSSPLSTVEENDVLMPSPFSPQPPSSLQPPPSPMQWSSLQSPPLLQAPPLLVSSAALQPPPLIMPSSSQSLPPSYSLSTPLPAVEDTNEKGNSMPHKRKERIIWTEELHQKFVWAVEQLGGLDNAVSKRILQIMNNPELNPKHISSHLQKYRKRLEDIKGAPKIATQAIGSPSVVHEQYPEMNDINMYMMPGEMNYSAAAVEQRANSHQQLHPNPSMMSDEPLELFWADSSLNYDDIFSDF